MSSGSRSAAAACHNCRVRAVLWDMDGTLVDSEKLWDISLSALYESLGGALSRQTRTALVGASAEETMVTVYTDLGLDPHPRRMAESIRWLHDYTADLFDGGLPWCAGAREMLEALAAERTPMALVTNTQRGLTEHALNSIGRQYFSVTVCADEVSSGKPAPDLYLRAAELLELAAGGLPGRRGFGDRRGGRRGGGMRGARRAQRCPGARWGDGGGTSNRWPGLDSAGSAPHLPRDRSGAARTHA